MNSTKSNFWKKMLVYTSSFALLLYPLPTLAFTPPNENFTSNIPQINPAADIAAQSLQFFGDLGGQILRLKNQAAMNRYQMQSRKNLLQYDRSQLFPQCRILRPSKNNLKNHSLICNSYSGDPVTPPKFQQARFYWRMATINLMSNEHLKIAQGGRIGSPSGLQCMQESRDRLDSELGKNLQKLEAQIQGHLVTFAAFKKVATAQKKKIKDQHDLLFGDNTGSVEKRDKAKIKKMFKRAKCDNILASNDYDPQKGLLAIEAKIDLIHQSSVVYGDNVKSYDKNLSRYLKHLKTQVKTYGIEDVLSSGVPTPPGMTINFQGIASVTNSTNKEFKKLLKQNKKDLRGFYQEFREFNISQGSFNNNGDVVFDKYLQRNFADIERKGAKYFKRVFVRDCIRNNRPRRGRNVGISFQKILDGYKDAHPKYRGSSLRGFVEKVRKILNDTNTSMDYKIRRISMLEKKYAQNGNNFRTRIHSYYKNGTPNTTWRTSDLLAGLKGDCQAIYDIPEESAGGISRSPHQKISAALEAIRKIRKMEKRYLKDISNQIEDRVKNCAGLSIVKGPGSCNSDALDPQKGEFCFKNANSCTVEINKCTTRTKKLIAQTKKQMKVESTKFDNLVKREMARQHTIVTLLQKEIFKSAEIMRKKFLADYQIPVFGEGDKNLLSVLLPDKLMNPTLNIELLAGGDLNSLNKLPKILQAMKQTMTKQRDAIRTRVNQRITALQGTYEAESESLEELKRKCWALIDSYGQQIREYNKTVAKNNDRVRKDRQKHLKALNKFCQDKTYYENSPGCGEKVETLYKDLRSLAGNITGNTNDGVLAYHNACKRYQGISNDDDNDYDYDLKARCENKGEISGEETFRRVVRKSGKITGQSGAIAKILGVPESEIRSFFKDGNLPAQNNADNPMAESIHDYMEDLANLRKAGNVCEGIELDTDERKEVCVENNKVAKAKQKQLVRIQGDLIKKLNILNILIKENKITKETAIKALEEKVKTFEGKLEPTKKEISKLEKQKELNIKQRWIKTQNDLKEKIDNISKQIEIKYELETIKNQITGNRNYVEECQLAMKNEFKNKKNNTFKTAKRRIDNLLNAQASISKDLALAGLSQAVATYHGEMDTCVVQAVSPGQSDYRTFMEALRQGMRMPANNMNY